MVQFLASNIVYVLGFSGEWHGRSGADCGPLPRTFGRIHACANRMQRVFPIIAIGVCNETGRERRGRRVYPGIAAAKTIAD